jgi:hypothetical protein
MRSERARYIGVAVVGLCSLWACVLWGLFPIGDKAVAYRRSTNPHVHQIQALEAVLPPDAVVSAHYSFAPHIAHRTRIYTWPNPFRAAYWGKFDREGTRLPEAASVEYLFLPAYLSDEDRKTMNSIRPEFMLLRQEGDFALYRRINRPGAARPRR